ncbi:MAG: glucose-1-phosphate adenylyltransferase [Planctomycetota bacterium]|nr:MAG: glucose-1-phosphate adenylyltransferase [Planctomycetota bacterium]
MKGVLTLVLAGGKGTRLEPLTRDRAKPAVPFGGMYRIIDFTLSNCINSGLRQIILLTQYKAASLHRHVSRGWRFLSHELDEFVDVLPPQQRLDEHWYRGTADAVYQNIYTIERYAPRYVLILAGDHIYKMDYSEMIRTHIDSGARITVGCIPVPRETAHQFGIMRVDPSFRITQFREKPSDPDPLPDNPAMSLASMGIYVFDARYLFEVLCQDATDRSSAHDFGKNIIPAAVDSEHVQAFPFRDRNTGSTLYWRDVGTLDAYYEANMDLVSVNPLLNLYDQDWPIRTYIPPLPPPKFVWSERSGPQPRVGEAHDSLVCPGTIVSGARVSRSILSFGVRVNSWALVEDSILYPGVNVGRHARVRRAILDRGVQVPPGAVVGEDPEEDRRRGFTVTESGITVVGRYDRF